ncbi:hypothetical protein [Roseibium sp.]|uniref:hypothetical protein n=1 Tax=Roseibium sp. TaxID=1936156 RepID=UPI003A986D5F
MKDLPAYPINNNPERNTVSANCRYLEDKWLPVFDPNPMKSAMAQASANLLDAHPVSMPAEPLMLLPVPARTSAIIASREVVSAHLAMMIAAVMVSGSRLRRTCQDGDSNKCGNGDTKSFLEGHHIHSPQNSDISRSLMLRRICHAALEPNRKHLFSGRSCSNQR